MYGVLKATKYGDMIQKNLGNHYITKRSDLAYESGGLAYEAKKLDMDMWDFLEAIEGMCCDGRAEEIDDSTYLIKPYKFAIEVTTKYGDSFIIETTGVSTVCEMLAKNEEIAEFKVK